MQLKGLVKFFTAALILISLYQISYTFAVQNVENDLHAKAVKQVAMMHPASADDSLVMLDTRYQALTDSVQGLKVVNMLYKNYTYSEAKNYELKLGLDLQGGMSVTLDVSLTELMHKLSNSPQDPGLINAIDAAEKQKTTSQEDFAKLFVDAFHAQNPGRPLAPLFTKADLKDITFKSSDEDVLAYLRAQSTDAINSTYNVLLKRIDKFGVASPSITLDKNRGVINVELAGVRNPELVRENLQATAKLQFFETYTAADIDSKLQAADAALAIYLNGGKPVDTGAAPKATDTSASAKANDTTAAHKHDTTAKTNITNLPVDAPDSAKPTPAGPATPVKNEDGLTPEQQKYARLHPLLFYLDRRQVTADRPLFGSIRKQDSAKVFGYLNLDVVKSKLPNNLRLLVEAQSGDSRFDQTVPLTIYSIKTAMGTESGSRLEGEHITDAFKQNDPNTGQPDVDVKMDESGSQIWGQITTQNVGHSVAIVLDNKVYSAPNVINPILGGTTSISGHFSQEEADNLADILKIGKLPAPARIVQEQVVGPTLGAENIAKGKTSLLVSFAIIFVLMLVYYNSAGIVANIALILNLLFTIGLLAALGANLTMPGIAGLVLTIGMAVDTNVIIFERIKEELSSGKGYQQAVADGYKRSYAPVLDGHITQLLTAIILFIAGLGPVKGFATTQIIGLLLSLYCGILVSRLVTDMWTKRERHFNYFTVLSKSIFKKAHFKFIELRKYTYVISFIVLALGVASYFHGYDKGVEFSGGRSYDIKLASKHTTTEITDKLKTAFGTEPVVKTVGTNNTYNITTTYLINDPAKDASDRARAKLYDGLKAGNLIPATVTLENFRSQYLGGSGQERTVLPVISDQLRKDAIKATFIALLAIFLYILIRFRKWQYSLGTIIALAHDVCVTLAVFSFLRGRVPFALELDQHFIAAILTVIGFSMNDTIIVFDRVREYFRKSPGEGKKSVINRAINDTLSRTIMTSLTVFLTVLILFIFGGEATRGFAFAMLIGVVTGTYSSIFVAAPILVDMDKGDTLKNEADREARIEELKKLS